MRSQSIFLALAILLVCPCASGQWVQTNGFGGFDGAQCFAASGPHLLFGTYRQGVFLTTDSGIHWTAINAGLPTNANVRALAISGTNLFAGIFECGIFVSTDNGTSWTAVNSGLTNTNVGALAVSGTNLFAGTWGGGVFLSTNNGTTWTPVNGGLPIDEFGNYPVVTSFAVSDMNLFLGTGAGVFLSTNNGTSWTSVNGGLTSWPQCLATSGMNLIAGTRNGIFLSTNNGANWTWVGWGEVASLAVSGANLYAGDYYGGVSLSTNNGSSWTAVGLTDTAVTCLAVSGMNLFAGTPFGVFRSADNGTSWTVANTGLPLSAQVRCFATIGTSAFACSDYGIYRSTDDGMNWYAANGGLPTTASIEALAVSGTNLFAVGNGVFLSTDDGQNWTTVSTGLAAGAPVKDLAVLGTDIFAAVWDYSGGSGVYRSTNNGVTWTPSGMTDSMAYRLAVVDTCLVAGVFPEGNPSSRVLYSTNQGTTWLPATGITWQSSVDAFAVMGTRLFWGSQSLRQAGVYLSTDRGANWTTVCEDCRAGALAVSGTNLFRGAWDPPGVFLSTDLGVSWNSVGGWFFVMSLAVVDSYVVAGDGYRIWRRPLSEMITSVEPASIELPHAFSLSQNYPNPFNPNTTITFELPTHCHVTLKVFDVLGREMATLVDGIEEPGYKSAVFDGRTLSSGIYYYRLQAGEHSETKKLVLLK